MKVLKKLLVDNCCCCCDIYVGSVIIGTLYLLLGIAMSFISFVRVITMSVAGDSALPIVLWAFCVPVYVCEVVVNIFLIRAVLLSISKPFCIWLVAMPVIELLSVFLVEFIMLWTHCLWLLILLADVLYILFFFYCWIVVYSTKHDIDERAKRKTEALDSAPPTESKNNIDEKENLNKQPSDSGPVKESSGTA